MAAFLTVIAVHFKPQEAFDLAVYTSIIINLVWEGRGSAWSQYDCIFRQDAAVNPGLPWNRSEQDISNRALFGSSHPPSHAAKTTIITVPP